MSGDGERTELRDLAGQLQASFAESVLPAYYDALEALAPERQDAYRDTGQNLADRYEAVAAQALAEPSQQQIDTLTALARDLGDLVDQMLAEASGSLSEEERTELRNEVGRKLASFHATVLPAYHEALEALASERQDAYRDTGQNLADRHASAVAQAFAEPSQEQLDAINEIYPVMAVSPPGRQQRHEMTISPGNDV